MKHINYILLILILTSCSTSKKLTEVNSLPTKFVFKKSLFFSINGTIEFKPKTDSLINKETKKLQISELLTQTPETEIHIEIKNNSIWRHIERNGKMIGDYFMIQKSNGILNYYDQSKTVNYKKYDLFAKNHKYEIIENRKDRKKINGFDCYKLTLIKNDIVSDLGNTVYEMYVTHQIKLPIHSVINLTKLVQNTFPMEIIISGKNLSGISEKYELIKMK
jgi:L-rhamnose isomerase